MTDSGTMVGPRLKAERERRGLSSQKAADELHLDGWIIDALEAEDYARIGPSVYAKGHLKRYAAFLGLPGDEIMAGYESRAQAPIQPASQAAGVRLRTDVPAASGSAWPRIAGPAVVLLGLLALGAFWWQPWRQHRAAPAAGGPIAANPNTTSSGGAAAADGTAAEGSAEAAGTDTGVGAAAASSSTSTTSMSSATSPAALPHAAAASKPAQQESDAATAGAGRASLRLSFSADSWVDVHDAAGRRAYAGNGRANSVKTIAGIAPMRVYLGFASGVQLEINNRAVAIGPQFLAGDVARFEAGADGVLRRDTRNAAAPGATVRNARPTG